MSLCIPRDDVTAPLITDFSAAFSAIKSAEDLTEQVIPLTTSIFHNTTAIVGFFQKVREMNEANNKLFKNKRIGRKLFEIVFYTCSITTEKWKMIKVKSLE